MWILIQSCAFVVAFFSVDFGEAIGYIFIFVLYKLSMPAVLTILTDILINNFYVTMPLGKRLIY